MIPSVYIDAITFNDGTRVELNPDDIVLFVGSNNVGKSRSLVEIESYFDNFKKTNQFIVEKIEVKTKNFENIFDYIKSVSNIDISGGHTYYRGFGYLYSEYAFGGSLLDDNNLTEKGFFVCSSLTKNRLALAMPTQNLGYNEQPNNLLQCLSQNPSLGKKLDSAFFKTFSKHLYCDTMTSSDICLRISNNECVLPPVSNSIDATIVMKDLYFKMSPLSEQGDGMKSFAAILLQLLLERLSVNLIDEPESFLHQPQAYSIAQAFSSIGVGKQFFISTHSTQFLLGLLENCPERLKIIRMNRVKHGDKEINPVTVLKNSEVLDIIKDPLLEYSNIFDGIFYEKAVIAESETDCKFYQFIYKSLKKKDNYFFTLSHGKDKMGKIITSLDKLGVKSSIILDIDAICSPTTLKNIMHARNADYEKIKDDVLKINSFINSISTDHLNKINLIEKVVKEINSCPDEEISEETRKRCRTLFNELTGYKKFKKSGRELLNDELKLSFDKINKYLNDFDIHLVECGELENFIPEFNAQHGPSWVECVLTKYNDINDPVFDKAKEFVNKF